MPTTDTTTIITADEDDDIESHVDDDDDNKNHQEQEFVTSAFPLQYHQDIDDDFTYEELLLEFLVYERILQNLAIEYDLSLQEVSGDLFPKLMEQFGYIGDNDLADAFWMSVVNNEFSSTSNSASVASSFDYLTDGGETFQEQQFEEEGQMLGHGVPEMIFQVGLVVSIVLGWHVCRQWWKKGKLGIWGLSSVIQRWKQAVVIEELLAAEDSDQNAKAATAAFNGGNRNKTKKKGRTSKKQPSSRLSSFQRNSKKNKSLPVSMKVNKESALGGPTSTIDQLGGDLSHSSSSRQLKSIALNSRQHECRKSQDEQGNRESQEPEKQQGSGILRAKQVNDFRMAGQQATNNSERGSDASQLSNYGDANSGRDSHETKDELIYSNHQGQEMHDKEICSNSGENLLSCHCDKCEKEREIFQLIIEKSLGDGSGGCTFSLFSGGQTIQIVVNGNDNEDDNIYATSDGDDDETSYQDDVRWEAAATSSSESKLDVSEYSDETFGDDVDSGSHVGDESIPAMKLSG